MGAYMNEFYRDRLEQGREMCFVATHSTVLPLHCGKQACVRSEIGDVNFDEGLVDPVCAHANSQVFGRPSWRDHCNLRCIRCGSCCRAAFSVAKILS